MLYYPNASSKANHFCTETVRAIWDYLATRRDPGRTGTFIARDLTEAEILIPQGGLRLLRHRGWIQRMQVAPTLNSRVWCLTESARRWLAEQPPAPRQEAA